jgi:hypothetical protein
MEYIKKNPDLQKAIELLRREGKVSRTALQFEFHWSEWKARKVYEALRYICYKGLVFKEDEHNMEVCRAYHGYVELIHLHREIEDVDIDESVSQEAEEEGWEEDEEEVEEAEEE